MANVSIKQVKKSYGSVQVMHGVDLEIDHGEFVVFVGPSGCGKSTLLRMIAGLEDISDGTISIGGEIMNEVAPSKRGVAMVFQTYALYPHMSVEENMAFGLKQAKTDPAEIDRRVKNAAEVLQITEYLDRAPKNLSGGQRQRVAIGRAIVRDPEVFLFDEPLSNLDASLRVQTRLEIARLHERLGSTMIYVTHDQVEALTLADKIVVLRAGIIEQVGSPMELYENPQNMFVAGFIGSPQMNFFQPADITSGNTQGVITGIRPEHLIETTKDQAMLTGTLELVEQLGEYALGHLKTDAGTEFTAKFPKAPMDQINKPVYFTAQENLIHRFDQSSQQRI
ncbi:alpha-glucoside transport ATP-binding protein AglK [Amylibacter marinus]|uniref:Alpha-glucoside transport ATP-binding protein AglK n=1 Tax=Amylibacter marinus TaxID=1475483 RepID=A0ABQ5VSN7_9RHOB|nr:sn-glycerol-3-phosphate ABC transporter ATP-binding protein UgpC [Amylibacter marinus]GLQ34233.1 alpha-glucoside transport ATP-binding protein AglK [Amylibacter marinus]